MDCRSINIACVAVMAIASVAFASFEAHAGAFAVREQSASGQGMAFAGEGTSSMGLSAMFWNPAAVTRTKGIEAEAHLTGILPRSIIDTLPGTSPSLLALGNTSTDNGKSALLSSMYAGYEYNQNLYVGFALSTPFGLSTESSVPWPGQTLSLNAEAKSIEGNPVIGYKLNDMISVAAGLRVMWVQAKFSRAVLPSAFAPNVASLEATDIGVGWNAGVTITPSATTELAFGYRSAIKVSLDGNTILPPVAAPSGDFGINGKVTLPDQANFGIRQRMTDSITLLGTVEWQNWSRLQNAAFSFTNGPAVGATATALTFNYRDAWYLAAGAEYQWSPHTTLRAGIGYEVTPITDAVRDPSVPYNDGWRYSLGMTHSLTPAVTLDAGYSYIKVKDAPINVVPGHPDFVNLLGSSFVGTGKLDISIISLAMRYRFGTQAALVRK
jgi:long-chain fatty acid transport protein